MKIPRFVQKIQRWSQFPLRLVQRFLKAHGAILAAGLTYYSLLSVIPSICVMLFFAHLCGMDTFLKGEIHTHVEEFVTTVESDSQGGLQAALPDFCVDLVAQTGNEEATAKFVQQIRDGADFLCQQIDQFDANAVGWIGLVFLLLMIIGVIGVMEESFNSIWGIKKMRAYYHRLYLYPAISFALPVLGAMAVSLPLLKSLKDLLLKFGSLVSLTGAMQVAAGLLDLTVLRLLLSWLLGALTFALLYYVLPHVRVSFRSAWRGGMVTALLFGGWWKVCAILQVGIARASMLYGSFAFLPILLTWIYTSWQIVLLGAVLVREFEIRREAQLVARGKDLKLIESKEKDSK